jgi:methionyl aminopeptidase
MDVRRGVVARAGASSLDSMSVDTPEELEGLRRAGALAAEVLRAVSEAVAPGLTTAELDALAAERMRAAGANSAPIVTYGFPGAICISVADEVVHGIPGSRRLVAGDLVKLDVSLELDGYFADTATTVAVETVERIAEARGFKVLRSLVGHGIGRSLHEPPTVYNYAEPTATERLHEGLVLTIEPMIAGTRDIVGAGDGWTVVTADGSSAAHEEHTIVVTAGEPIVLTAAA